VGESNAAELSAALATLGAETLLDALESIEDGSVVWAEQDSTLATYAEKIAKSEIALDPSLAVVDAVRRVRASSPQAPARAIVAGRGVTVERARIAPGGVLARPGGVAWTGDVIVLGMCDGDMEVDQVKPDGKKSMKASEWARGLQLDADSTWEAV
jgi:methionyl-tRNA formyltransferase